MGGRLERGREREGVSKICAPTQETVFAPMLLLASGQGLRDRVLRGLGVVPAEVVPTEGLRARFELVAGVEGVGVWGWGRDKIERKRDAARSGGVAGVVGVGVLGWTRDERECGIDGRGRWEGSREPCDGFEGGERGEIREDVDCAAWLEFLVEF